MGFVLENADVITRDAAAIRATLTSEFDSFLEHGVGVVRGFAPVDEGTYRDSITKSLDDNWPYLVGEIYSMLGETDPALVNTIEDGRAPGATPPPTTGEAGERLVAWAARHGFENPERAKYPLAITIGERGTPAFAPFGKGFDELEGYLPTFLAHVEGEIVGGRQ